MSRTWTVLDRILDAGHGVQEDSTKVSGNLAWVIDGASPLDEKRLTSSPSDARWLVDLADQHLRRAGERQDSRPLASIVRDIAVAVSAQAQGWTSQPKYPPSASLGVVRNSGETIDYLVLADVLLVADTATPLVWTDAAPEGTNEEAMGVFRDLLRTTGSFARARDAATPLLAKHRETRMNTAGGYWILADDPDAAAHALSGEVATRDVPRLLLCTDGFSRIVDVFGLYESWSDFFSIGPTLDRALREIRAAEAKDRQCVNFPRWSVSDDTAAMLITPS